MDVCFNPQTPLMDIFREAFGLKTDLFWTSEIPMNEMNDREVYTEMKRVFVNKIVAQIFEETARKI